MQPFAFFLTFRRGRRKRVNVPKSECNQNPKKLNPKPSRNKRSSKARRQIAVGNRKVTTGFGQYAWGRLVCNSLLHFSRFGVAAKNGFNVPKLRYNLKPKKINLQLSRNKRNRKARRQTAVGNRNELPGFGSFVRSVLYAIESSNGFTQNVSNPFSQNTPHKLPQQLHRIPQHHHAANPVDPSQHLSVELRFQKEHNSSQTGEPDD